MSALQRSRSISGRLNPNLSKEMDTLLSANRSFQTERKRKTYALFADERCPKADKKNKHIKMTKKLEKNRYFS